MMEIKKEKCHFTHIAIWLWVLFVSIGVVTFIFSLFHSVGDKEMIKFLLESLGVAAICMSGGGLIKSYQKYKLLRDGK